MSGYPKTITDAPASEFMSNVHEPPTPKTILLVEDDMITQTCIGEALADAGFEVLEAADASEALAILEREHDRIHMVCTDVLMPGIMDGVGLAHQARAQWPEIKLLVLSGQPREELEALPIKSVVLGKPYDPIDLVQLVNRMLS